MAFWTRSGFLLDMSEPNLNNYPVTTPTAVGDCVSGVVLVAGIMTALYNREKTGKGEVVKTALYGVATWTMCNMIIQAQKKYARTFPQTRDMEGALTSKYRCKDGEWFLINALDYNRDAGKVYDILGVAEEVRSIGVVDYIAMTRHNAEVAAILQREFLKKDCDEWARIFKAADVVSGPMSHFRDVNSDEQAWANGFLEEYTCHNGETCVLPRPPIRLDSVEMPAAKLAPQPGDQTDEVLRAYGYSEAEIADMHACGAVK
jgi:crotonobetainyl-CoA:carnitine CoA-transferase CaiB-like acyl-CoA transferase